MKLVSRSFHPDSSPDCDGRSRAPYFTDIVATRRACLAAFATCASIGFRVGTSDHAQSGHPIIWLKYVTAGLAAVISSALTPIALLGFAVAFGQERFTKRQIGALALA